LSRELLVNAVGMSGFAALACGVGVEFGLGWCLIVSGALMLAAGLAAVRRV